MRNVSKRLVDAVNEYNRVVIESGLTVIPLENLSEIAERLYTKKGEEREIARLKRIKNKKSLEIMASGYTRYQEKEFKRLIDRINRNRKDLTKGLKGKRATSVVTEEKVITVPKGSDYIKRKYYASLVKQASYDYNRDYAEKYKDNLKESFKYYVDSPIKTKLYNLISKESARKLFNVGYDESPLSLFYRYEMLNASTKTHEQLLLEEYNRWRKYLYGAKG